MREKKTSRMRMLLVMMYTLIMVPAVPASQSTATVACLTLRAMAITTVMPIYPAEALRRKLHGRVVIEIVTDSAGEVASMRVLESPEDLFSDAVQAAVKRWRFRPVTANRQSWSVSGRLVFYFREVQGKAIVVDAAAERLRTRP